MSDEHPPLSESSPREVEDREDTASSAAPDAVTGDEPDELSEEPTAPAPAPEEQAMEDGGAEEESGAGSDEPAAEAGTEDDGTILQQATDRGTVKWYSLAKGYGFLLDEAGGPDIFVHHSALKEAGEDEPLLEGEKVEFHLEDTPRGRRARHVRRI